MGKSGRLSLKTEEPSLKRVILGLSGSLVKNAAAATLCSLFAGILFKTVSLVGSFLKHDSEVSNIRLLCSQFPKSPTFVHSAYNSTSTIDLAVASPTIALDFQWSVHDDLCGSDHFPIFLKSHAEDNTTHPRYNFKKANWNLFGDLCSRSIDLKILESDCPVELFTEKVTAAAREAIPPYRGGKNLPSVPWFTDECKQAILDRKRAQRKYFKHPTLLNFINFKKAKAKSKFTIKQSKASIKSVWKKIRKIKN